MLADGLSTHAFGHKAIPAVVHTIDGEVAIEDRVLSAGEAHRLQLPLVKRKYFPTGQDPASSVHQARQNQRATIGALLPPADLPQPPPNQAHSLEDLLTFMIDDDD